MRRMAWLFWTVSVAAMTRSGRYAPHGVAVLARIGGRYELCGPLFCCAKWRLWPVSVAVMSHIGRYVPYGVAVLARVGGRYEP